VSQTQELDAPARGRAQLVEALERVARGDERALKQLYQLTSAKLFGICLCVLKERNEAEDALQDVFVSIWKRASTFDSTRASPITWLATIARNRAIDRLRSNRSRNFVAVDEASEVADDRPDGFASAAEIQERDRLHRCLEGLQGPQQNAIRSAFYDGLAYSHLAERDGVPEGTMKSWIRRGLTQLKGCLGA
jgi:RNA polymerase sigma-70 factor (ECF subfamily)